MSDIPKKFARILEFEKKLTQIPKKQKQAKVTDQFEFGLKIQSGENLGSFNHRVNMTLGNPYLDKPSAPSQKKEKRKLQRQEKRKAIQEAQAREESYKDFNKLTDNVKFGEIVMAPPRLTSKPKDRAKNKRELLSSDATKSLNKQAQSFSSGIMPKAKKFIKTPAEKRILETERVRLVGLYRKLKTDRMNLQNN